MPLCSVSITFEGSGQPEWPRTGPVGGEGGGGTRGSEPFSDFANMILTAKNKKIKGKEHQIGSTILSKDGKYKTTKFG